VARALDHHLNAGLPGPLDELAERQELFDLGAIRSVDDRPGTKAVAEAEREVVSAGKVEEAVELREKGIFFIVVEHPGKMEGSAAGDDIGNPALILEPLDRFPSEAAVDGHKIDAFPGLGFDRGEEVVNGHLDDRTTAIDGLDGGLIDRNGSEREGGAGEDFAADSLDVASSAQIHDRVCAEAERNFDFAEFRGEAREVRRSPDIDIDFGAEGAPNACRFFGTALSMPRSAGGGTERGRVVGVKGDDHPAARDEREKVVRGEALVRGHFFYGGGRASAPGEFELCHIF